MALATFTCGPWTIEADPEATRNGYDAMAAAWISSGRTHSCACPMCRNLYLQRPNVLPVEVRECMGRLGIDPERELDSNDYCRDSGGPGLRMVEALYPIVGRILGGPEESENPWNGDEPVRWTLHFDRHPIRLPVDSFARPQAQLNLILYIPWKLQDEPEPN